MDLYANEWETFRRITLPLVMPGISRVTFPPFVFGANQRGTPPQINVIGALMFLAALALVGVSHFAGRRRAKGAG